MNPAADCGVRTRDDRRAVWILVALALVGVAVRWVGTPGPPGAVAFRSVAGLRPSQDSVAAISVRIARPLRRGERIDVDRASPEDLTRLPRIGPALARRIVEERERGGPFGSASGLIRVAGIGPKTLDALVSYVTFSGQQVNSSGATSRTKIPINKATVEQLADLPGVGPVRARAIVAYRRMHGRFQRLDDLTRVPGIGPVTVRRLMDRVTVR